MADHSYLEGVGRKCACKLCLSVERLTKELTDPLLPQSFKDFYLVKFQGFVLELLDHAELERRRVLSSAPGQRELSAPVAGGGPGTEEEAPPEEALEALRIDKSLPAKVGVETRAAEKGSEKKSPGRAKVLEGEESALKDKKAKKAKKEKSEKKKKKKRKSRSRKKSSRSRSRGREGHHRSRREDLSPVRHSRREPAGVREDPPRSEKEDSEALEDWESEEEEVDQEVAGKSEERGRERKVRPRSPSRSPVVRPHLCDLAPKARPLPPPPRPPSWNWGRPWSYSYREDADEHKSKGVKKRDRQRDIRQAGGLARWHAAKAAPSTRR